MIYTSTELFNAFTEDTRQIMVRVKINGAVFDNDNISTLNLEYGSMDGANLGLGSTFASSLKITFAELVEGLAELDEIEVEMGAVLPNGTIEYVPMGIFIINEEVMMDRNNNTTSIDALDRMVMLGNIYESTLPGESARIFDIAVDIANQAGVVVSSGFDRLRTDRIQIPREKTLREAIGLIAQFEVGFATFNRDGELAIRKLSDPYFNITPEDYTMKGLVKNEVPFRLNGVQCQIGDSENDTLQAGTSTGNQIILNNPSMTQEHLDRIYTELNTLNYYPFTLDWYGHPALEAGDWIEIEDLQGNKFKTPNLHYTLDFNGGLKAKSQAETTSSSEVVYQYKSPLKQEIQTIAARLSASGGNHVYDDLTPPTNPKEGDLWFKPEGPDTIILIYERLEDGSLDWVEKLNTGDTNKNAREIEKAMEEVEEAKRQAKSDANQAYEDARAHADAELERINTELTTDIGGAIEAAEQAKQDAIDKANQAYEDAKAHADSEVQASKEHFDNLIEDVESEVADAQATADEAVNEINTAITNAGFTSLDDTISNVRGIASGVKSELDIAIENAGFTSLDETVQNMTTITINAEESAQQAITNASNAYGLAQTSISEAQTAQANSLTALGNADNALDGVKSLNVRVDDVEGELELKADNTFMTEDGELITLSNAITFNAHRFSSDMSRIESRVESLAGEINLVILRDAFEGAYLVANLVYPNPEKSISAQHSDTMRELIEVTSGEQLALSKDTVPNDNYWRIIFYGSNNNYISRVVTLDNQYILTVPAGATKMWVSYPQNSRPQIIRGTNFIPYRPNMTDQMTTDEVVMFRNEYDEFADKTERRLTSIDSSGGRLATAELLITQTANGLALKADQTTVNELTGEVESLGTEFDVVAGQVSSKVWMSDIDDIEIGGRNLIAKSAPNYATGFIVNPGAIGSPPSYGSFAQHTISGHISLGNKRSEDVYTFSKRTSSLTDDNWFRIVWLSEYGNVLRRDATTDNVYTTTKPFNAVEVRLSFPSDSQPKLERGNMATDWTPAPEDTDAKIDYIETEWTQTFEGFEATVSDNLGTVNTNIQTLENSLSAISDPVTGRLTIAEQSLDGFRNEVYNQDGSSKITQLATGISSVVSNLDNLEIGGRNLIVKSASGYARDIVIAIGEIGNPPSYRVQEGHTISGYIEINNKGISEPFTFSKNTSTASDDNFFRIIWLSEYGNVLRRDATEDNIFTTNKPINAVEIRLSFPSDSQPKLERGNKATDYTEAPEDNDAKINHIETEWTQTFDTFSQTVSGIDGRVTEQKQTIDTISSTVYDEHAEKISKVEQTASGLQSTVADKANQSQVTQLANGLNSVVTNQSNLVLNPYFEGGRLDYWTGLTYVGNTDKIRSTREYYSSSRSRDIYNTSYIAVEPGEVLYLSMRAWASSPSNRITLGLRYFDMDKNHLGWSDRSISKINGASETFGGEITIPNGARFAHVWVNQNVYDNFDTWFFTDVKVTRTPDYNKVNSQITQLADNINLRVKEGDVVNQINVSTEGILIDGKKTHITGKTTIDDGVIKNAHIANLNASKINAGTIKTARLNATEIVAQGLTADVIEAKHIKADTALIEKLFATKANVDILTAKEAFIASIKAVEIDASKITSGTIDTARLDAIDIVTKGLTADVIKSTHILADTALFDKLFTSSLATDRLSAQTAWIKNGMFANASIDGAKIQDATIGSAKIVDLDVSKISGETSNFVQSAWNSAAGGSVSISGSGILSTDNTNSQTYIQNGVIGFRTSAGHGLGYIGVSQSGDRTNWNHDVSNGSNWLMRYRTTASGSFKTVFEYVSYNDRLQTGVDLSMTDYDIRTVDNVYANYFRLRNGGYIRANASNSAVDIKSLTTISLQTGSGQAFRLDDTHGYMYRTLSMEGNNVTNQSDRRLKLNIKATDVSSLDSIKSIKFVEFDRTNGNHDEIGVIAQDTPSLALYDSERDVWSINSSKQIMMNSHAIQQLYFEFDERVESNESKIHKLQQELSKANRRIEELEGAI